MRRLTLDQLPTILVRLSSDPRIVAPENFGALVSPGGHADTALPSWHPRADISTIVAQIEGPVTSFQRSAVVTEQGMTLVFGNIQNEQTHQIIENCAHPDARPLLGQAAKLMGRV